MVSGEAFGQVPGVCREAPPFPERGRKAQHLGARKPPSPPPTTTTTACLWPEAPPCVLISGDRPAGRGWGMEKVPKEPPRDNICPLCFRAQCPLCTPSQAQRGQGEAPTLPLWPSALWLALQALPSPWSRLL